MKRAVLAVLMATLTAAVGCTPNSPTSMLDSTPMTPNSVHCGHVKFLGRYQWQKDDGTIISFFFTGGSDPIFRDGPVAGILCASVPSFDDDDNDSTYYFRSFKPDSAQQKGAGK